MFIRYLAVFLWLALPGLAEAELLQYRYTDTQEQVKEQSPAQRYGNPAGGEVAIALSGGLDRRVRVELWRGSRRVTTTESEVLGWMTTKSLKPQTVMHASLGWRQGTMNCGWNWNRRWVSPPPPARP